jgi:hypothetical protein
LKNDVVIAEKKIRDQSTELTKTQQSFQKTIHDAGVGLR